MRSFLWMSVLIFLLSCDNRDLKPQAGICLSFDDRTIDHWFNMRDLLNRYHAKVTFFVTQFDSLSEEEIHKLKILQNDGHEIGSHGRMHVSAEEFIKENSYGAYLSEEIDNSLREMQAKGFSVKSFAYPYGSKYWLTDYLLLKRFKAIRSVTPLPAHADVSLLDDIYCVAGRENTFYAVSIDHHALSGNMFDAAISRATANKEVLFLYGHAPVGNDAGEYEFQLSDLELILAKATDAGLKFYTFSQVTSDQ